MHGQTARLRIRKLMPADAGFILELATDPDWLRYIGDRGIRDLDSARNWIESGPMTSYRKHGFGLDRLGLGQDDIPIGICGLLQRENTVGPELGFALLPAHRGRGYAREAAAAVIEQLRKDRPELGRLYALATPDNLPSGNLLRKLGFVRDDDYRPDSANALLQRYRLDL
ncbi:MAG: GNAT family N-acetyltransferase [Gammaproteobacteria bacterium]|nr:GNAT family N-acetyltransferase [Gammaproteobacteria bacterium]